MALYRGREGSLKYGVVGSGTAVQQVSDWKIDSSMEILDGTSLGDTSKVKVTGLGDWKGSFSAFFDNQSVNTQQAALIAAALAGTLLTGATSVTFYLTAAKYFYGDIIITGMSVTVAVGDLVKIAFTFEGSGPLALA